MPHEASVQPEASTASTGLGIRYIGNWAYALSGTFTAHTPAFTMLEFTTGAGYIDAYFNLNGQIRFTLDIAQGGNCGFQISFNDEIVGQTVADTVGTGIGGSPMFQRLIIPPLTLVKVEGVSAEINAQETMTCSMRGRVYGAE